MAAARGQITLFGSGANRVGGSAMPRLKLTAKAIDKLKAPDPSGRQALHWDSELRGFGVLCSGKTNAKTYIVQRDIHGRTRRVTIGATNVLTLDVARGRAEQVLSDFYRGLDPKRGRRAGGALRQVLDDYLAARRELRPRSNEEYRRSISRHLATWLDRPLREVTPEMVVTRHGEIAQEVERASGGRWSGLATANGALRAFGVLWNFAARSDPNLPGNPVLVLRRQWFKVPRRERLVRADQLPAFYKAVTALPNPIARDYLLLLLFTGLRRNEAAGLRWDDVDFAGGVIRLPGTRTKAGRKLDLPMTDFVRDLLVARRAIGQDGPFVFPSNSQTGFIREPKFPLRQVATASGVDVSAHDLRRTFVTVAESSDISPLALKALVNHSLGNDVTAGYVILTTERLREPAQRVCDRMKKLCGVEPVAASGTVVRTIR